MGKARISAFLTTTEVARARTLWRELRGARNSFDFVRELERQIIVPHMARINKAVGQKNTSSEVAYAVEDAFRRELTRRNRLIHLSVIALVVLPAIMFPLRPVLMLYGALSVAAMVAAVRDSR